MDVQGGPFTRSLQHVLELVKQKAHKHNNALLHGALIPIQVMNLHNDQCVQSLRLTASTTGPRIFGSHDGAGAGIDH